MKKRDGSDFLHHISTPFTNISATHSLFVNDTVFFGKYVITKENKIKETLDRYCSTSGKKINASTSKIYMFNTSVGIKRKNSETIGFSRSRADILRIPFLTGANNVSYWSKIIQNYIKEKKLSWKGKWIYLLGQILMIKSILVVIPNYYMVALKAPKSVTTEIEKVIKSFLWKRNIDEKKKKSLISLENMYYEKLKGGQVLIIFLHENGSQRKVSMEFI